MMARLVAGTVVALVAVAVMATPAAAHGGPGGDDPPASNYRSRILRIDGAPPGLEVRVVEAGSRLELANRSGDTVVVLGYEEEPYLRVGPDGVFENAQSPATYLNLDRSGGAAVPEGVAASAPPQWRRIGDGTTTRWHDHRAHWMGGERPPAVTADGGSAPLTIREWTVPLTAGTDRPVVVTGDLAWVRGPSPLPWYGLAAALALAVIIARRWHRAALFVVPALAGLVGAAVVDVIGVWQAGDQGVLALVSAMALPVLCATMGVLGITQLRRFPREAWAMIGIAGASFAVLFGLTSLDWFGRSQLPTTVPPWLARASIAVSLGLGAGMVGLAALRFRRLGREAVGRNHAELPHGTAA